MFGARLGGWRRERMQLLRAAVPRDSDTTGCPRCGSTARRVPSSTGELRRFGGYAFARSFRCPACSTRVVGRAEPMPRAI